MTAPRLVALDLSLTGTGIAGLDQHRRTLLCLVRSRYDGHARLQDICVHVADALRHVSPHLVVIEGLYVGHNNNSLALAELHGLIKQQLWLTGVPYVLVAPQTRAVYACGTGRADKTAVKAAVEARYGRLCATHDEADALTLLAMAADHYGAPITAPGEAPSFLPEKYRRALAAVKWPAIDIPESPRPGSAAINSPGPGGAGNSPLSTLQEGLIP